MTFLRFLMLLALVIWIGGIIFFAFVVAPALFGLLPSPDLAGSVVEASLGRLHWIGVACGAVFLASSLIEFRGRITNLRNLAITLMVALTLVSQIVVIGQMQRLHVLMGSIAASPANDPLRLRFDSLHHWSTTLESLVLLFGLVALYDTTRSFSKPQAQTPAVTTRSA